MLLYHLYIYYDNYMVTKFHSNTRETSYYYWKIKAHRLL